MISISDAEILDIVRRLRQYLSTLDNCHSVYSHLTKINDEVLRQEVTELLPEISNISKKLSVTLKNIENNKIYRDMLKKFHIKEEPSEE